MTKTDMRTKEEILAALEKHLKELEANGALIDRHRTFVFVLTVLFVI